MYKGYTVRTVMDEYAITFFTMLNNGYRQQMERYKMLASIASVPHMKDEDRKDFMRQLEYAATDPSDILDTEGLDDYSGLDKLKEMFGQK